MRAGTFGPTSAAILLVAAAGTCLSGCSKYLKLDEHRWFNPTEVVRRPSRSPIMPILKSGSYADESQEVLPNATPPQDEDIVYSDVDYILGPTDVLQVTIWDLYGSGQETVLQKEISETGMIDLPFLASRIRAEGQTKEELKDEIVDAYSPEILVEPRVSVAILAKRNNTFSVYGGGVRAGTYQLYRPDMRLLEGLAQAGGIGQTNLRYIYVIRMRRPKRVETDRPTHQRGGGLETLPTLPEMIPPDQRGTTAPPMGNGGRGPMTEEELRRLMPGTIPPEPTMPMPETHLALDETSPAAGGRESDANLTMPRQSGKFVYAGGRWIPAEQAGSADAGEPNAAATAPLPPGSEKDDPFGWNRAQRMDLARIIVINYQGLINGEARQNIILRNGDMVKVPELTVGEFYLAGDFARPGVYTLTNREITIKQAVAAGGNFGALAWPENAVLIRRIGPQQEQFIPLDIEAIFQGKDTDLILKPNDIVACGSHWAAPFLAVLRNAFRYSYGFAFIYDRNFSDPAPTGLNSKRFTIW